MYYNCNAQVPLAARYVTALLRVLWRGATPRVTLTRFQSSDQTSDLGCGQADDKDLITLCTQCMRVIYVTL